MPEIMTRLSLDEAFALLEDWQNLVRIEQHPHVYDGKIVGLSKETGTVLLRTAKGREGTRTIAFELAGADFLRDNEPEGWQDVLTAFLPSDGWLTLRHWKR
jgi:hypothetical protein